MGSVFNQNTSYTCTQFPDNKKDGDIKVKIKYQSFSIGHGTSSKSDTHFTV